MRKKEEEKKGKGTGGLLFGAAFRWFLFLRPLFLSPVLACIYGYASLSAYPYVCLLACLPLWCRECREHGDTRMRR